MTPEELQALWEQSQPANKTNNEEDLTQLWEQSSPSDNKTVETTQMTTPNEEWDYSGPIPQRISEKPTPKETTGLTIDNIADELYGLGEAGLSALTGLSSIVTAPMGFSKGVTESLLSGNFGTQKGAEQVKQTMENLMGDYIYQPKSQEGLRNIQTIAETLQPLEAFAPLAIESKILSQAAKPALNVAAKSAKSQIVNKLDNLKSLLPESKKVATLKKLSQKEPENIALSTLDVKKNTAGKDILVTNKPAKDAISNGFDEGVVSSIKSASKNDKEKMFGMLQIHKKGTKNKYYAQTNRPTDVVGNSLQKRIDFLYSQNKNAGKSLETFANNTLKGEKINYEIPVNNFKNSLNDIGVELTKSKNGRVKINLENSNIFGDKTAEKVITNIVSKLGKENDVYDLHKMKQFIDTQVKYGKKGGKPMSDEAQNILKSLRRDINDTISQNFEGYKQINTTYKDTIEALNNIQKSLGTSIDMTGPNANKAIGTASRKLLSNSVNRVNLMNAMDEVDSVAKKYGMKINDNVKKQIMFADELDRRFGSHAPTSLGGELGKTAEQAIDKGITRTLIEKTGEKVKDTFGKKDIDAIRAMERLLNKK